MSVLELEVIAGFIRRAVCVEDVFGNLGTNKKEREDKLKHSFRKLALALHPDSHNGDAPARTIAQELFKELEQIRTEAQKAIADNRYGKKERLPWKVSVLIKDKYVIETPLCAGSIADLHIASLESAANHTNYLLKIARNTTDNDLLLTEKNVLEAIHEKMKKHKSVDWPETIPTISESFLFDDRKAKRRVNVMENFNGFYNVEEIKKRLPKGVDGRTIVWMWKRLLVLLEWVNKSGYIHGAVLPPHVMFYPDNDGYTTRDKRKHSVRLVDWCYAVDYKNRTRLSAWVSAYKDFYAPEILDKKPFGGWTDLYMGAKTMLYIAGDVPDLITKSILSCTQKDPKKRPQSIGKYFEEFAALAKKEYGASKYHDFNLTV